MSTFAVVNLKDGLRKDVEPFLLNNDAFPILENAYLFRGRIERRSCFTPVGADGRLKKTVEGTTDAFGVFTATFLDAGVTGGIPVGVASFQITGTIGGSDASATLTDAGGASPVTLITTNANVTTRTLDRASGLLTLGGFTGLTAITVAYLPGLPVMGLRTLEQSAINSEQLMAFDNRYAYQFDDASNDFSVRDYFYTLANKFVWTGVDTDLFWSTNYYGAFWATNNVAGYHAAQDASPVAEKDGIRWYGKESVTLNTGWANFNPGLNGTDTPPVAPTNFLLGALIILSYKDRLVCLNTYEAANLAASKNFPQRARWSQNGTPFYGVFPDGKSSETNAWSEIQVGKGGFIDAPTQEAIVSAQFIKDTLIVYFERSTWQLVYTNNEFLPFIWQKINTELGCESTFSVVPFDSGVFAVGNYGIISTDSVQVQRIDQKIPDEVFQIQNINDGVKRVTAIRDYNAQLVYFSYPIKVDETGASTNYELTFPNQLLVFNYLEGSWAEFDDSFTCFGYWQKFTDTTWQDLRVPWETRQAAWNSGSFQGRYPNVVSGNQRGFVMVFSQLQLNGLNSPSIPISDITPASYQIFAPDHNFVVNQYVRFSGIQGVTSNNSGGTPNNVTYKIGTATDTHFTVLPVDPNQDIWAGTYTGGGLVTHMPNIYILSKQFNPFYESGNSVRVNYIDILADRTSTGEFSMLFYSNSNTSQELTPTAVVTTQPETALAFSGNQTRIWHRAYTNLYGSFFQTLVTLSDEQMRNFNISVSDITLHGFVYYVSPCGRISYDI